MIKLSNDAAINRKLFWMPDQSDDCYKEGDDDDQYGAAAPKIIAATVPIIFAGSR